MTYYDRSHSFVQHEIETAVHIARQLGFSLERLEAERARRQTEDQFRLKQGDPFFDSTPVRSAQFCEREGDSNEPCRSTSTQFGKLLGVWQE